MTALFRAADANGGEVFGIELSGNSQRWESIHLLPGDPQKWNQCMCCVFAEAVLGLQTLTGPSDISRQVNFREIFSSER